MLQFRVNRITTIVVFIYADMLSNCSSSVTYNSLTLRLVFLTALFMPNPQMWWLPSLSRS